MFFFLFLVVFFSCFFCVGAYGLVGVLVVVGVVLGFLFLYIAFLNYKGMMDNTVLDSYSMYECSFGEINSVGNFYTLQFFGVALSFMLFDMEIILMFPFVYSFGWSILGVVLGVCFLGVLMFGLLLEFYVGIF